ncbi:MAG: sigma-70 family RNA polymerase sigma factor [Lachnospiraceae bacterium]|nr:sigma-70 family RNA polymerase sigma factor [Lachnospiraceae bacterium]
MREQAVIRKLKEREESSAEELLLHYGPLLRYVIGAILSDERDREECVQDAVLKVWREIGRFDAQKGSWTGWLTTIARNLALNRLRSMAGQESRELTEEETDKTPTPEEALLRKEQQDALQKALGRLKKADCVLFYRKYYYRQTTAQIAAELGTTERAVEGRLYRIKAKLRIYLEGGDHGGQA